MKKQIIFLLFLLGNITNVFSQNKKTAFDDLIGTYQGITAATEERNKITAELTADFNFKVIENFDGLLIEHINEKVSPQFGKIPEDGDYIFDFKALSIESEFSMIRIGLFDKVFVPGTNINMTIVLKKDSGEKGVFAVTKLEGSPKMPTANINFSDIHNSVFISGQTEENTFGDFKIQWYTSEGFGYLNYKNVTNIFQIEKKGHKYRLTNKYDIDFEYTYNESGYQKMKLLDIHSGRNLIKQHVRYGSSISAKIVGTEKDFLTAVGKAFYDAIQDRYKPKGNYTLTHKEKLNGNGIGIVSNNEAFAIYAGGMKDGVFEGEGRTVQDLESSSGTFKSGVQNGHFNMKFSTGAVASGEFVNGLQEGLWKIKQKNGATFDLIMKGGEKISSKHTNSDQGVKNERITKLIKEARDLDPISNKIEDIGERLKRCVNLDRDENTLADYKYCLAGLRDDIDEIRPLLKKAIDRSKKTIKEAEKEGCHEVVGKMETIKHDLEVAKDKFQSAKYYIKDLMAADGNKKVKKEAIKIGEYLVGAEEFFLKAYNRFGDINICYKYPDTGSSTVPTRSTVQNNSTSKPQPQASKATNKKSTSQNSSATTARPIVYPTFTGKYEGDNLLRLMGRKVDDPAVQKLLKNPSYEFERVDRSGSLREKIDYECYPYRFSLSFVNGVLTYISFEVKEWDNKNFFKKKLPLNIPLAKSTSAMKRMKDKWKHNDYGSSSNWTLKKYQLKFEVMGGGENNEIQIVNINAEDIKDWNSYYQQFQ